MLLSQDCRPRCFARLRCSRLLALAKPWKQKVNIYNALAASAFLLLLFDPYMIMSVGFQLSYLAVLGIVYLQPRLYAWWEPESRIWDEIWKVTSVSIAAQIATLPLDYCISISSRIILFSPTSWSSRRHS